MKPKNILLVEDNSSDIGLTRRAFSRSRIVNRLVVVEDGEEAIDYLFCTGKYSGRDPLDLPALVLLDLKMPKVDGIEVLGKIRSGEATRRIPVVILTSSLEDKDIGRCYDLGANSYIRKPVDFSQFMEAIEHLGLYWLVINEAPPQIPME